MLLHLRHADPCLSEAGPHHALEVGRGREIHSRPNLPTNIVPTNIARVKISGNVPMHMRIPPR